MREGGCLLKTLIAFTCVLEGASKGMLSDDHTMYNWSQLCI